MYINSYTIIHCFSQLVVSFGSLLKTYTSLSFVLMSFVTRVHVRVQLMTFTLMLTMMVLLRLPYSRMKLLCSNMSRVTA